MNTLINLLLVILGFGGVVFLHELGHFLAARWAGIRVLAFALGFGPAAVSFRKGLGWRRGSSEAEYMRLASRRGVSPTEYRLNVLPFGGYVRMLGQEDLNPDAVSAAPDSYQMTPVWKRMVVISAGVIANLISACIIFMFVFWVGMKVEPAQVGWVAPGSPAAKATIVEPDLAAKLGSGLRTGDRLVKIDGRAPNSFADLVLATAMSRRDGEVLMRVQRPGIDREFDIRVKPEPSRLTGLLEIGVEPARSPVLVLPRDAQSREAMQTALGTVGLPAVQPGSRLVRIGSDREVLDARELDDAVRASGGAPVELEFTLPDGATRTATITPQPALQSDLLPRGEPGVFASVEHVLGLTGVMKVASVMERGERMGLRDGDIFALLGTAEFPSPAEGVTQIRGHAGRTIPVVVLRREGDSVKEVTLDHVEVTSAGTIGFGVGDTAQESTLLAAVPARLRSLSAARAAAPEYVPAAASLHIAPGSRLTKVGERTVENLADVRDALRSLTLSAGDAAEVPLTIESGPTGESRTLTLSLAAADLADLRAMSWTTALGPTFFEAEQVMLRASGPLDAVKRGYAETRRVMLTTYVTFLRLTEGTVKIEHLKGPVGIAHLGTLVADRGIMWLLFFLALISVNLAVINFLPLPIVDGGQFVFLLLEQIRGTPVPLSVQNAATMVGLVLIAGAFLVVTFHDVKNLLGL